MDREHRRALRELQDKRLRDRGFTVVKRTGTKVIAGEHAARLTKELRCNGDEARSET